MTVFFVILKLEYTRSFTKMLLTCNMRINSSFDMPILSLSAESTT